MNWKFILPSGLIAFGLLGMVNATSEPEYLFRITVQILSGSMILAGSILHIIWRKKK